MKHVDSSVIFHIIKHYPEMTIDVGSGDESFHISELIVKYYETGSVKLIRSWVDKIKMDLR
jgi:hypothetical protein